ncbi:hypothetical protein N7536_007228 [Penicillium majusculum]|uniref:Uncharacterized protein n=1 Tax=Penicillium solitum TaxID=60172 RepID=A0A1V6RKE1_9EURO|nr:uncharacterized protein PENSOL_c002G01396 [Penicillium solitum]KAJ5696816.1 hypothetical protein N7536_007228 [Penicillium majusculum]OQE02301.1 hypothetical protein PENSOL_c002G01396 [Penicillium solitum]
MKFGYSFVGTISPTFNIVEAYGFFDSKLLFLGSIDVDVRGAIDVDSTLQSKQLFTGAITGYGFSHPGICDMGPSFNAKARLIGTGHSLDAKFTANVIAGNGQYTKSNLPLTLENPNAGHHAAIDAYNCEDLTTTDNSNDPTLVYVSEHGLELQYLPRLLEFFRRGTNRDPDGNSVWDPTGSQTGIPNDRIWEAFGSGNNPQRNVNTEQTLNGYKARVFAGTSPMSDTTWNEHGYNEWNLPDSVERVNEALSVVNQVTHVFNYWNDYISYIVADSLRVIGNELAYFARRVNAVDPQRNLENLGRRHMEFAFYVVNARLERVESWVRRRLEGLRDVWTQAEQAGHPNAAHILNTINNIVEEIDNDPNAFMTHTETWNVPSP